MAEFGTHGGVHAVVNDEKHEKSNARPADNLDEVLTSHFGVEHIGGYIVDHTFQLPHEFARTEYVSYDRFYYGVKLLVDFFSTPVKSSTQKDEIDKQVIMKRSLAKSRGFKYLAIFDGQLDPSELKRLVAA